MKIEVHVKWIMELKLEMLYHNGKEVLLKAAAWDYEYVVCGYLFDIKVMSFA
jgi:hypothetical protein